MTLLWGVAVWLLISLGFVGWLLWQSRRNDAQAAADDDELNNMLRYLIQRHPELLPSEDN